MKDLGQLSTRDLRQLSAFLDGELSARQTEQLRARLDTEPDLKLALGQLQATAALLHDLPRVQRPRSFTVTQAAKPRGYPVLQFSTALAALAFIILVSADVVLQGTSQAPEQAMIASEDVGALADADRSLDSELQPEVPAAGAEAEGALNFAAPADELAAEIGEPAPAEESAAEVGEPVQEEAEAMDEYFKSPERDAEPLEATEGSDLTQAEDALSEPLDVGEAVDSVIAEQGSASRERNLMLPALRIGELILGLLLVLLVGLILWARRR